MAVTLSRRGLFRAFGHADAEAGETIAMVARVSQACVEPRGITCRRCGEECGSTAIQFRPQGGGIYAVAIDADVCSGCGDCLPVCPTAALSLVAAERVALMTGIATLDGVHQ